MPAVQATHLIGAAAPVSDKNVPAGHGIAAAEPAGQYEPAGQMMPLHWEDPVTVEYDPPGHGEATADPAKQKLPAGQMAHWLEAANPVAEE